MSTTLTIDELEREILYLRDQNQKILRELSRVIEENSAFREKLHSRPEMGGEAIGGGGQTGKFKSKTEGANLKLEFIGMSTSLK